MRFCVNEPGRLDTSITCDDVTVGSRAANESEDDVREQIVHVWVSVRSTSDTSECVCVVAMFLQTFACPYMSLSVFTCECHNKSSETCLSLFCVHASRHEWKRLAQSDRSQTASFVYQMEICCHPPFIIMMMVSSDCQILDLLCMIHFFLQLYFGSSQGEQSLGL